MNKILISKTLTLVALLGMAQDGWGTTKSTITIIRDDCSYVFGISRGECKTYGHCCLEKYTNSADGNYNMRYLKSENNYIFKGRSGSDTSFNMNEDNLIIPQGVNVEFRRNDAGSGGFTIDNKYTLVNYGSITNNADFVIEGTFTNATTGTFTNNDIIGIDGGVTNEGTFTNTATIMSQRMLTNNGTFYNNGTISSWNSLGFEGTGRIMTWGENGKIALVENNGVTINSGMILSFGYRGTFSGATNSYAVLEGTIEITDSRASVHVTDVNFFTGVCPDSSGTIDMNQLHPYSKVYSDGFVTENVFTNNNFFIFDASQPLPNIKLPFNCSFSQPLNLSNAKSVSYTVLSRYEPTLSGNTIIGQFQDYGDYADGTKGVTLPNSYYITRESASIMKLSYLATNATYNQSQYKLWTDDLDENTDNIATGVTRYYNFGFTGSNAISITGPGIARFRGDNSEYTPSPAATISANEVEFCASNSLFPFEQAYKKGTFSAGSELENTIPANKTITFTNGFTLGAGHTLIVRGTLIG